MIDYKTWLFDCDGVILDSNKIKTESYYELALPYGKDKADKLIEEVRALGNPKINEVGLIKIADFLPQDSEELNKLFSEVNLTEEEAGAILNIIRNY